MLYLTTCLNCRLYIAEQTDSILNPTTYHNGLKCHVVCISCIHR